MLLLACHVAFIAISVNNASTRSTNRSLAKSSQEKAILSFYCAMLFLQINTAVVYFSKSMFIKFVPFTIQQRVYKKMSTVRNIRFCHAHLSLTFYQCNVMYFSFQRGPSGKRGMASLDTMHNNVYLNSQRTKHSNQQTTAIYAHVMMNVLIVVTVRLQPPVYIFARFNCLKVLKIGMQCICS